MKFQNYSEQKCKLQKERFTSASNLFSAVTNGKLVSSATAAAIFASNLTRRSFLGKME